LQGTHFLRANNVQAQGIVSKAGIRACCAVHMG